MIIKAGAMRLVFKKKKKHCLKKIPIIDKYICIDFNFMDFFVVDDKKLQIYVA